MLNTSESLQLTDKNISNIKSFDVIKQFTKQINSIDFSEDGLYLIASSNDDSLILYNIPKKETIKKLYNKDFGIENAIFTHSSQVILCSSSRDFRIMYWNLHNNEVIYSFLGHTDLISDLTINPKDDTFLSVSQDKTSRLWDLNGYKCLGIFQESTHSCFDNTGDVISSVFTVTKEGRSLSYINLYNSKDFHGGNFNIFLVEDTFIRQVKFSNDGVHIFCFTDDNSIVIVNSFEGNIEKSLSFELDSLSFYKADVSVDGKYIAFGSDSGNLVFVNVSKEKDNLVNILAMHPKPSRCVRFNPVFNIIASSCENLVLWEVV